MRHRLEQSKAYILLGLLTGIVGAGCGGGSSNPGVDTAVQISSNNSPVAVIESITANPVAGSIVELSSVSSTDADGDDLSYEWTLEIPNGSHAIIESVEADGAEFEPDMPAVFTVRLQVSDGKGGSDQASLTVTPTLPLPDALPGFADAAPPDPILVDRTDAVRFLYQATFGPRDGDIEALTEQGVGDWFRDQLSMQPHFYLTAWESIAEDFDDIDSGENANFKHLSHEAFMLNALDSPDQLRQRMTYALSQLLVISDQFDFAGHDQLTLGFADTLHRHAFGNYRALLRDVTLHPAMGMYLAMLGNEKADPDRNIRPDENFAREVMQLFTLGLQLLNQDGSPKLNAESGEPAQTYSPVDVQNYAAALTGWYFSGQEIWQFGDSFHSIDWQDRLAPMSAYDEFHQKTQKKLLGNYYIPAGSSAEDSLETTLDSLFYHPNLGPFVSRHLIKSFVTSNPSADYVGRVTAVFNSNASRERGNLASVIQAVLFDPEAREDQSTQGQNFGKVKDPLLKYLNFNRLFSISGYLDNNNFLRRHPSQRFLSAHSVFNFYNPAHVPNRAFADLGLVAPELEVITPETIVSDASLYAFTATRAQRDYWALMEGSEESDDWLIYAEVNDLTPVMDRLETSGLMSVIDFLDEYMTQGQLTVSMRSELIEFFAPRIEQTQTYEYYPSEAHRTADIHQLLQDLIYQITLSTEYSLQR